MGAAYLRMPEERWTRFETLVSRLFIECRRLQRENQALVRATAEREHEIAQLRAAQQQQTETERDVRHLLSAKEQIQERIDDLLARIDLLDTPLSPQTGVER